MVAAASCLNRKPDRAPFPPIQFQKESPREKEKAWTSGNGARADAPTSGRRGAAFVGFASPQNRSVRKKSQATTHAERAKLVGILDKVGSNRVQ